MVVCFLLGTTTENSSEYQRLKWACAKSHPHDQVPHTHTHTYMYIYLVCCCSSTIISYIERKAKKFQSCFILNYLHAFQELVLFHYSLRQIGPGLIYVCLIRCYYVCANLFSIFCLLLYVISVCVVCDDS